MVASFTPIFPLLSNSKYDRCILHAVYHQLNKVAQPLGHFSPPSVLGYLVPQFHSSRGLETFEAHAAEDKHAEDKHAPCAYSEWNEANATTAMHGPRSQSTFLYTIFQGKQSQLFGATHTMYCNRHIVTKRP